MDLQQKGVISIVKSALTGENFPLSDEFDVDKAAATAKKHQISSVFYYGALNCGVSQELPAMQQLFIDTCCLISVNEHQLYAINEIFKRFDENKIEYMPLKGTLLKKLYPKAEMRVMSDADILIRTGQYDTISSVMTELGYEETIESDHELIWRKNGLSIELHKRLIPSYNKDYYKYFGDGWKLGKQIADGATRYAMTPEDEMIYLFTHFAKHYRDAGIGIKHIVDLWVFRSNNKDLDNGYILRELEKLELKEFYLNIMQTLDAWFEGGKENAKTDLITSIIFSSGHYGTREAHLLSEAYKESKSGEELDKIKNRKFFKKVFLPYNNMVKKYPVLQKCPFLLPVMWGVRIINIVFFKRDKISNQIKSYNCISDERMQNYGQALNFVGLDFNFEE